MRKLIAIAAVLLWSGIAAAQHSHGSMKGPNGGPMQDIVGVHAELMISGNVVTINVLDESNKPTSAKGFSGTVLIGSGGNRETVQLQPVDSALKGGQGSGGCRRHRETGLEERRRKIRTGEVLVKPARR